MDDFPPVLNKTKDELVEGHRVNLVIFVSISTVMKYLE